MEVGSPLPPYLPGFPWWRWIHFHFPDPFSGSGPGSLDPRPSIRRFRFSSGPGPPPERREIRRTTGSTVFFESIELLSDIPYNLISLADQCRQKVGQIPRGIRFQRGAKVTGPPTGPGITKSAVWIFSVGDISGKIQAGSPRCPAHQGSPGVVSMAGATPLPFLPDFPGKLPSDFSIPCGN